MQQQLAHSSPFAHTSVLGSLFWFNLGRHFAKKKMLFMYLFIPKMIFFILAISYKK